MGTGKQIFFASLLLLTIFACKTQKEQPHRYVDYQPYFDQTRKEYMPSPSPKNAKLDTLVQIMSNLRDEVYEFKDTVSLSLELELSEGELIIDIDKINEKPPIFDTFMVVKGYLFKDELVNTLFPVMTDSIKTALLLLNDSLPFSFLTGFLPIDHPVFTDSFSFVLPADTILYPNRIPPVHKSYFSKEEILADTTRDLLDAESILNNLITDIPWKKGDSIPYFKGFSNYLNDSLYLLKTDSLFVEIFDTSRVVKQYPGEKLKKETIKKFAADDQLFRNEKVVFRVFYKYDEDVFIEMVRVQGGSFKIGSNQFDEDEQPQYGLNVSSFLLGKFEMTNQIFCSFMNYIHCDSLGEVNHLKIIDLNPDFTKIKYDIKNGRFFVLKDYEEFPVINVTWAGASFFCIKLGGRLPSEAEWEYAAKGGVYAVRYYTNAEKTDYDYEYRYAGGNTMSDVGWFVDNSYGTYHRKGRLKPNQLGIYDLSGNVWEWCYDNYGKDFYKRNGDSTDPMCINGSGKRVNRGGSWSSDAQYCRVTNRNFLEEFEYNPYLGFRFMCGGHK
jgi:formylglycine-generating enzyme required for sulfatase activity